MRNFTFLSFIVLISCSINAQSKTDLQMKFREFNEKYANCSQRFSWIGKNVHFSESTMELKNAVVTQKLDSIVNRIFNDETKTWQLDYKDEFIYNSGFKSTAWTGKVWNSDTKSWEIDYKTEYGYDNDGRIISMQMFDRDTANNVIELSSKLQFYYNSDSKHDSVLTYFTEDAGKKWLLIMKQVHQYNASKQLVKTNLWSYDEDEEKLILSSNTVYTYHSNGKIKSSATNFIFEDEEFTTSKTEYFYDNSDRLITEENSVLNFMNLVLEKSSRNSYQYNSSGKLISDIFSKWNGTSWINDDKSEFLYNVAGDVTAEILSNWDGNAWIEEDKYETVYGTTNFSDVAFPSFIYLYDIEASEFVTSKIVTSTNDYLMVEGNWVNTEKSNFYYSGGTSTNINEIGNSVVTAYPNPASAEVRFNWNGNFESLSLEIYQITGAKVLEQITYSGKPVSISNLNSGVYFFRLLNNKQMVFQGKLIKE